MTEIEMEMNSQAFAEVTSIFAEREMAAEAASLRMHELDNKDRLMALAIAAYGTRWQTEVANALSVSDRSVRAWVSGKTGVSKSVLADMRGIVQERHRLIRNALLSTASVDDAIDWMPVIVADDEGMPTSKLVSIGDVQVSDGDLVRTIVTVRDPGSEELLNLVFAEEIADGLFVSISSHFWTWHRQDWIDALNSECHADVLFEVAKALIRERHPDLTAAPDETAIREELSKHGFEIVGRDRDAHFHWLIRNKEIGHEGWYASLRAAARELLPEID